MRDIKHLKNKRVSTELFLSFIPVDVPFSFYDVTYKLKAAGVELKMPAFYKKLQKFKDDGFASISHTDQSTKLTYWVIKSHNIEVLIIRSKRRKQYKTEKMETQPVLSCDLMPKVWQDVLCRAIV